MNNKLFTFAALFTIIVLSGCQHLRPARRSSAAKHEQVTSRQKADVQITFAKSAESRGDVKAAINAYETATSNDDSRAEPYQRLGVLHFKQGNLPLAEKMFRDALARAEDPADVHCDFGYCFYLQGRFKEAEEQFRGAIKSSPMNARAHNNLGMVLGSTNRHDAALDAFSRGGLSESDARTNLSFAMMMQSDMEGARQQLKVAKAADRNSAASKRIKSFGKALAKVPDRLETNFALAKSPQPTSLHASQPTPAVAKKLPPVSIGKTIAGTDIRATEWTAERPDKAGATATPGLNSASVSQLVNTPNTSSPNLKSDRTTSRATTPAPQNVQSSRRTPERLPNVADEIKLVNHHTVLKPSQKESSQSVMRSIIRSR